MKIAIIGTAGRSEPITKQLWDEIKLRFWSLYYTGDLFPPNTIVDRPNIEWVSGGAAGLDHLAVRFCGTEYSSYDKLTLHLPCAWDAEKCQFTIGKTGGTANYYHRKFSQQVGIDSLADIQRAIDSGAHITISKGFHARNMLVGNCDILLAMTFGTKSGIYTSSKGSFPKSSIDAGLRDGGTAHTWNNSGAPRKIHINLNDIHERL